MAHVIPTLRTTSRVLPSVVSRRQVQSPSSNRSADTSFGSILKTQTSTASSSTGATTATATPAVTKSARMVSPSSPAIATSSSQAVTAAAATPAASAGTFAMAPTAQSLFGDNPWISNAGGSGPGGSYSYNPYYFATAATADKVAQMLGGTVVAMNALTPYGPFVQSAQNYMVQMPNGRLINAGLVASFYDRGLNQQMVDKMVAAEVTGDTMIS
jgi:hypothetical protein